MNELLIHGRQFAGPALVMLDLLGTFVFALSGAAAGVKNKLDLFGLMVLAFATGNAGGITRDLLIGAVPPAAIHDWPYLAVCLSAGLVMFWWYPKIDVNRKPVLLLDAAGLALFAVTGTQKRYCWSESGDGCGDGHAERHRRHRSRHPCQRNAYGAPCRSVLRSSIVGRTSRRRRAGPPPPASGGHDRGRVIVSIPPTHGHLPRLASANCESLCG